MVKGTYEYKASLLSEEVKINVNYHLQNILSNKLNPSRTSMEYLFEIFNENINTTPSDIECNDCRRAIRDFWIQQTTLWNQEK